MIRETICTALRQHLLHDAVPNWSHCTLNFAGARFHNLNLSGVKITSADFTGAVFTGTTLFEGAVFVAEVADAIKFDHTRFVAAGRSSRTSFCRTGFDANSVDGISFAHARFSADRGGSIDFDTFSIHSFWEAGVSFQGAHFCAADFARINFRDGLITTDRTKNRFRHRDRGSEGISFESAIFTAERGGLIAFERIDFSARAANISFAGSRFAAVTPNSGIVFLGVGWNTDNDGIIDFMTASFEGDGAIAFLDPPRWVGVRFPWDADPATMPPVVSPRQWPPASR
ncbi:pentapeptide repeat-containing protein [Mycobacterium sp. 155]|uniref:pentapeptide repeat-containing protein n=1 Tax=Mycobacterium sp. 155 TaxID=1157943 RepID=UPI00037C4AC3|nr:pentapeptide repeat-containing protein [Mycobacterium sp. 155]